MIRTLLVDDDEAILNLFSTVLEMSGFSVEVARSGSEAIRGLSARNFEVVITDLRMETHTAGFEVVRAAVKAAPRPLVIVVTAFPVPSSEWRKTGADALYVKGTSMMALPDQVKELLQQRRQSASTSSSLFPRQR